MHSHLNRAYFIYDSAHSSIMKVLDPIHFQGMRLSAGAFRTNSLRLAEWTSLATCRSPIRYPVKMSEIRICTPSVVCVSYEVRRRSPVPTFCIRLYDMLDGFWVQLSIIHSLQLYKHLPWTHSRSHFDLSLSVHSSMCRLLFVREIIGLSQLFCHLC